MLWSLDIVRDVYERCNRKSVISGLDDVNLLCVSWRRVLQDPNELVILTTKEAQSLASIKDNEARVLAIESMMKQQPAEGLRPVASAAPEELNLYHVVTPRELEDLRLDRFNKDLPKRAQALPKELMKRVPALLESMSPIEPDGPYVLPKSWIDEGLSQTKRDAGGLTNDELEVLAAIYNKSGQWECTVRGTLYPNLVCVAKKRKVAEKK